MTAEILPTTVIVPEQRSEADRWGFPRTPVELRALTGRSLGDLCDRIRAFLIEKVCATGGHLGANLGVVELTVALHRVFDSPRDVLLFDTGHQAYVHKILTGRAAGFDTLRQAGGLSGYPSRNESEHDQVESSHASTALAYADGIAKAHELRGETGRRVVAIIGDGALSGGLAWEGFNNLAERPDRPVVIVLNDNARSYDETIGGLARHLAKLRDRRQRYGTPPTALPPAWPHAGKTMFEQLGLAYIGPIDGHDLATLQAAFDHAGNLGRSAVVHCVTEKGRGYSHAEADTDDRMHGIGAIDPVTGKAPVPSKPSWTSIFAEEMVEIGRARPDVVAVTGAMRIPVGLREFGAAFPERLFDVGIAEQHAVCSAAGMSMAGLRPVVAVYATFLNRAFDQVLMEVALHHLPVTFVLDRAGITGPDGASHHGMWDISILGVVPGLKMAAPRDPARLRELLREAVAFDAGPTVVRFPKATAGADLPALTRMDGIDILHRSPELSPQVLIVSAGTMAPAALDAARDLTARGIGVTVADPRWILPVDPAVPRLAARHDLVITIEDGVAAGGAGAALQHACLQEGVSTPVRVLGLPREFIAQGDRDLLLAEHDLTAEAVTRTVLAEFPTRT